MRELSDRWILPLAGQTVTRCCVDDALNIELSEAGSSEATIQIIGALDLQLRGRTWRLDPQGDAVALAPALALVGLTVDHAEAFKDGTLNVAFRDGSSFQVAPDRDYEAWVFAGRTGAKAVSLPGGDIAVWRSAA
ncbi:MAG TPA: DUF6188 family protein [Thermomicrobiales bacterium]|jgi:hypothetical protein|nr:DUF6188 family protein [Thermomicrobiales bacterium]